GCQSQGSGCGSFRSTFVPYISSIPSRRSKRALVVHLVGCAVPGCGGGKAFSRDFSGRVCGTRSLCGETSVSPFATGQSAICRRGDVTRHLCGAAVTSAPLAHGRRVALLDFVCLHSITRTGFSASGY